MTRLVWATIVVVLLVASSISSLHAQVIHAPVFTIEPGAITTNAVSAPLPTGSSTGLHFRFVATFATPIPWLTAEVGTSFAPLGLSNGQRARNEPTIFYGPRIMLLPRDRTRNWLELALPVLGSYRIDESGAATRIYVNDLVIQGVALVPVGQNLMRDMGSFWSRLTLYGIIEQNLTPARNVVTDRVDRFNPVFQYGVSIVLH